MSITKKLLEIQKKGITLKKDGTNPHFRSSYVTLNEVLEKVKEPLNDAGIVLVQSMDEDTLVTTLADTEDDTSVVSRIKLTNIPDMQKLGAGITYARRYALISLLALEDEDDDGNSAVAPKKASGGVQDAKGEPFTDKDFSI